MPTEQLRQSSFRDPDGRLHIVDHRIFRSIRAAATPEVRIFIDSAAAKSLSRSGKLIETWALDESKFGPIPAELKDYLDGGAATSGGAPYVLEHRRVWFPSYAHEWAPGMLFDAGSLTLEIATAVLDNAYSLKDATPHNVLFEGTRAVFVDILSFEKRDLGDPQWLPLSQFIRTFVLPLLVNRKLGISMEQIFTSHRDGLEPEEVYRLFSGLRRFFPPLLSAATIPTWLNKRADANQKALYSRRPSYAPDRARFVLETQLRRARKLLERAAPQFDRTSTWSSYLGNLSYTAEDFREKSSLVEEWLSEFRPTTVLDVGCNTGHFSAIAAKSGARVVAIDLDPLVVDLTRRRAVNEGLDILPLVVNLARPSPALGWRNAEQPSFLQRASGAFDMVMMLAVLHHLLVTERIPLREVFDVTAELTTKYLILEYVSKDDPLFQHLTRGREALHEGFTHEAFEKELSRHFAVLRKAPVKGDFRWLYLLQKKIG